MSKATKPRTFSPTIKYTGRGKMHPEFNGIIEGFCGTPQMFDLQRIRRNDGETIHDAAARYVRKEFEKAAKGSGYKLDPAPFKITIEID